MKPHARALSFAVLLLLISSALIWRFAAGVSVSTDIRDLLPAVKLSPSEQAAIDELQQLALSQHMLLLGHSSRDSLFAAVDAAEAQLEQEAALARAAWPSAAAAATPDPYIFLAQANANLTPAQLVQRALQRFYGLASLASGQELSRDPFGVAAAWRAQTPSYSSLSPVGHCLYRQVQSMHWCLLPLRGDDQGMSLNAVQARVEALERLLALLRGQWPDLKSLEAGVSRHAQYAADTAKQEFSLISSGTAVGIVLLILLLLRSLKPLLSCLLMLAVGGLFGLTACLLVFPQPHLIALVFGACLLGVAVDYAFHFLLCPGDGQTRIDRIRSGLHMGWISTSLGFAMLLLAPFDSLRQLALFGVFGLAGAWFTVIWLLPLLPASCLGDAELVSRHQASLKPANPRQTWPLILLLMLMLGCALRLGHLQTGENVRALHAASPALLAQDAKARDLIDGLDAAQLFVVRGANDDSMLASVSALDQALQQARQQGQIRRFMAISQALPTRAQQKAARAHWEQLIFAPGAALEQLQQQLQLPDDWVQKQRNQFATSNVLPLQRWKAAGGPMQSLLLTGTQPAVSLVRLGGVRDLAGLQQLADRLVQHGHDISFYDPLQAASDGLARARTQALQILALALIVVLIVLSLRYGISGGLLSALPLLLGLSGALAMLVLRGQPLNLFAVFALLLVTGMAIDYGVFLREAGDHGAHSLVAVIASALTTLLAFGLLGFSSTPALRDFGQLVASGIFCACLSSLVLYKSGWMQERR